MTKHDREVRNDAIGKPGSCTGIGCHAARRVAAASAHPLGRARTRRPRAATAPSPRRACRASPNEAGRNYTPGRLLRPHQKSGSGEIAVWRRGWRRRQSSRPRLPWLSTGRHSRAHERRCGIFVCFLDSYRRALHGSGSGHTPAVDGNIAPRGCLARALPSAVGQGAPCQRPETGALCMPAAWVSSVGSSRVLSRHSARA